MDVKEAAAELGDLLYAATSMADLVLAMGINRASLYATFGDKRRLFLKALERYIETVLEPRLAVLDETDSGLDIDALRIVSTGVNKLRRPENAQLVITHYQRLLNYIVPDFVHVLVDGRIIRTGDKKLALELEEKGYDWIIKEEAVTA